MANPAKLTLQGTVRDFKSYVTPTGALNSGGHIDFENVISSETGIVETVLGIDKKPIYRGGDHTSILKSTHEADAFDQWYRDVPGVNQSTSYAIELELNLTTNIYTFDSKDQSKGRNSDGLGGFFPIDNQGFGNEGRSHNYSFTYELHTQFTYQGFETLSYTGDDDVWVFIDNQLVIDLGGVHQAMKATVDLNARTVTYYELDQVTVREVKLLPLNLQPQTTYDLDIFFAERHTQQSNFRMDTSLVLVPVPIATIMATAFNADKQGPVSGEFTISLNQPAVTDLLIHYTVAGTAVEGIDYEPICRSLLIQQGTVSATISIDPIVESTFGETETVVVTLAPGTGYQLGPPISDTVAIVDTIPVVLCH